MGWRKRDFLCIPFSFPPNDGAGGNSWGFGVFFFLSCLYCSRKMFHVSVSDDLCSAVMSQPLSTYYLLPPPNSPAPS